SPGSVSTAVECLRIGIKLDQYRETARMVLEPWIVEAAFALWGKATNAPRTGSRAEGYPNTDQGPVARLVGRYAVKNRWCIATVARLAGPRGQSGDADDLNFAPINYDPLDVLSSGPGGSAPAA